MQFLEESNILSKTFYEIKYSKKTDFDSIKAVITKIYFEKLFPGKHLVEILSTVKQ